MSIPDSVRCASGIADLCFGMQSKLPFYAPSTSAFQRLSFAYETLSKPTSRRMYDLRGAKGYNPGGLLGFLPGIARRNYPLLTRQCIFCTAKANTGGPNAPDETLHSVLRNVVRDVSIRILYASPMKNSCSCLLDPRAVPQW